MIKQHPSAMRLFKWVFVLCFISDRVIKNWVQSSLPYQHPVSAWPGILQFTYTLNTGAAFSLFKQWPVLLLVLSGLFIAGLGVYIYQHRHQLSSLQTMGWAMVFGGAFGNWVDRLQIGAVVDYIELLLFRYPIFNLADAFIFCGIACLLMEYYRGERRTNQSI
jgi:signal peptidase II